MSTRRINITMQAEIERRAKELMRVRVIPALSELLSTLVVEEYERRKLDPQIEERLKQVEAEIRENMRRNHTPPRPSAGAPGKPHNPSAADHQPSGPKRGRKIPSGRGKHPTGASNG